MPHQRLNRAILGFNSLTLCPLPIRSRDRRWAADGDSCPSSRAARTRAASRYDAIHSDFSTGSCLAARRTIYRHAAILQAQRMSAIRSRPFTRQAATLAQQPRRSLRKGSLLQQVGGWLDPTESAYCGVGHAAAWLSDEAMHPTVDSCGPSGSGDRVCRSSRGRAVQRGCSRACFIVHH